MAEPSLRIGWIGVGSMGLPMLGHLVRAGHDVTAYDTRAERIDAAVAAGAKPATDLASLAMTCDVLCTMVFDDAALEAVVRSVSASSLRASVLVDFSTVSPSASARVARQLDGLRVAYLRAPVSGSVSVAEAAALSIFVSGSRQDHERCRPLLGAVSQAQRYVGGAEAARVVKLGINLLLINQTALLGETLALANSWGVPREEMVACINSSVIGSRHTQARAEAFATRRYSGAGPLQLGAKDMDLALSMAREMTLGLPLSAFVRQYLTELLSEGHGAVEISMLAEFPRQEKSTRKGKTS